MTQLYLGTNTSGSEGFDCTGQQGFILNLVYGEATATPPVTPTGEILLQWWTDSTQQVLLRQELYEVNAYRLTTIQGSVHGRYFTITSKELSTIGWWTHCQFFAFPLPIDFFDVTTPYGNIPGVPWVLTSANNYRSDNNNTGLLFDMQMAVANGQVFTFWLPAMIGEIEFRITTTVAGSINVTLAKGRAATGMVAFGASTSDDFTPRRMMIPRRVCRLILTGVGGSTGTIQLQITRKLA